MVEGVGLENRRVIFYLAGSNPVPFNAAVAQLARAFVLHVGGYGFESHQLQIFNVVAL